MQPSPSPAPIRLASLDAFRGLIMLTLLCGGIFQSLKVLPDWQWLAEQNEHVVWDGCVYWDLIQPGFMYIVGVAIPFASAKRAAKGDSWLKRFFHVLIRAMNLILLGVILDNFSQSQWSFGFIRVLQQIAFGYVFAFLVVGRGFLIQAVAAGSILLWYQLLWMFNPWNGPDGPWAFGGPNIGTAFDFWMLGRNYSGNYVGMNAIPSTATMIFGVMAGHLLMLKWLPTDKLIVLLLAGVGGVVFGAAVHPYFPVIKKIWTPSFAIYSAGLVTVGFAWFYWIIDGLGWKRWAFPLIVVGMNSTAAYCMGGLFGGWFRSLTTVWVGGLETQIGPIWYPVFQKGLFAVAAWCVLYWFYRRKIFFKL